MLQQSFFAVEKRKGVCFCRFMYDPFSSVPLFAAKRRSYTCGNDSESSFFLDDFDRSMGILETSCLEAVEYVFGFCDRGNE